MDPLQHDRFAELFVRNQANLYRYVVSIVPHRADADELFQQTSLTLWRIWERFDTNREFLPWAFAVAQNEIRNFFRRQQNRPKSLSDELIGELTDTRLKHQDLLSERQDALTDCLERLSPKQKELVDLCYARGQPMKTIAQSRGQTAEALYKAMQRIRDLLFDCVDRTLGLGVKP